MAECCDSWSTLASSTNLSDGLAPVSRRISFQVPLMISFCSSASLVGLLGVLALLPLVLGRAAGRLFALAEDLLEVADLGEEHVARRSAAACRRGRCPRPRRSR